MTYSRRSTCFALFSLLLLPRLGLAQPLEGEEKREAWQRVPEIAAAMEIREGSVVADVGAGYGFLTVRLAALVGKQGKVYAVDVNADSLKTLRQRAADATLRNIEVITGAADDPRLPAAALDAVVILNAYHEMEPGITVLRRIGDALKPGGRLVISEPWSPKRRLLSRAEQVKDHFLSPELMVDDLERAGFVITQRTDEFTNFNGPNFLIVAELRLP